MNVSKIKILTLSFSALLLVSACGDEQDKAANTDIESDVQSEEKIDANKPQMDQLVIELPASKAKATNLPELAASNSEPTKSWQAVESDSEEIWEKSKQTGQDIWTLSKKSSKEIWNEGKESSKKVWQESKESSQQLWQNSQKKTSEAWDKIEQSSDQVWQENSKKMEQIFNELDTDDFGSDAFDKQNEAFAHDEI